jgi:hypothetical protein
MGSEEPKSRFRSVPETCFLAWPYAQCRLSMPMILCAMPPARPCMAPAACGVLAVVFGL